MRLPPGQERLGEYGVSSFFVATDGTILPQETFTTKWKFIGLQVPNFVMVSMPNSSDTVSSAPKSIPSIIRQRLRDFQGIDKVDDETRCNLMNFSYYLTVGDLDEAYRSVETIKSCSIWENMARMCVKTRRLDVAQICISNLSSSKGASARIASSLFANQDIEAASDTQTAADSEQMKLAMIAIDLEMYDEAEQLLTDCGRFDVIVKMYQALGQWQKAIEVAEQHDRVNLRAAYYQYAEYLKESGNIEAAVPMYEKSGSALQTAQMLYQHQRFQLLRSQADVTCFRQPQCKYGHTVRLIQLSLLSLLLSRRLIRNLSSGTHSIWNPTRTSMLRNTPSLTIALHPIY